MQEGDTKRAADTQAVFSCWKQGFTSIGVGRIFCLPSYQGERGYHVFNVFYVYSHFVMYLSHQVKLRHPEKLPEVTGTSRGNPGFPAAT